MNIRLIVPSVPDGNRVIKSYSFAIAKLADGFTATQATGGWMDKGKLVIEPVTVFDCNVMPDGKVCTKFYTLAKRIATDLSQTCVYLSIDGIAQYVKP